MSLSKLHFNTLASLYVFSAVITAYINTPIQYLFGAGLLLAFIGGNSKFFRLTVAEVSFLLFIFALAVSTVLSEYPSVSFVSFIVHIANLIPILLISLHTQDKKQLLQLLQSAFYAVAILILLSLTQVTLDGRFGGVAGQANGMAFLSSTGVVLSYIILKADCYSKYGRLFCATILALSVLSLILTMSRAGLISVFVFLFVAELKSILSLKKRVVFSIAVAVLVCTIFYEQIGLASVLERFQGLTNAIGLTDYRISQELRHSEDSVRLDLISTALNLFYDNIVFGNGLATFEYHSDFVYTHTNIYEILYSTGLSGFVSFYMIYISSLYLAYKFRRKFKGDKLYGLIVPLIVFHLSYGFFIPFVTSKLQIVSFVFLLSVYRVLINEHR